MRNSSSLNQSHSRACPLVFKQWPDQTKVFSWSLMACCFVALVFYFGHVTKAFRCPCHHCYHLVSKDTQAMSPLTGLVFFIYDFGQPNFYFCLSRNIIWLHFGLVEPKLRTVFAILFSLNLFLHCLSNCLEQSILSGWVLCSKSVIFVFITIMKFLSNKVLNSVLTKLSQSLQKILLQKFTKFCKGSCHPVLSCIWNSWVAIIIIHIFELQK